MSNLPPLSARNSRAELLVQRLKEHYPRHIYLSFIRVFQELEAGALTKEDVSERVQDVLSRYPEVLIEYNATLEGRSELAPGIDTAVVKDLLDCLPLKNPQTAYSPEDILEEEDVEKLKRSEDVTYRLDHQMVEKLCEEVKAHVDEEAYSDLLRCMKLFHQEIISKIEAQKLANCILGEHTQLAEEFCDLFFRCEAFHFALRNQKIFDMIRVRGPSCISTVFICPGKLIELSLVPFLSRIRCGLILSRSLCQSWTWSS